MIRNIALAALLLGGVIVNRQSFAGDDPDKPVAKLGQLPNTSLLPQPPTTDAQHQHIRELIASFAKLDKPDFGLSATMSGTAFAPLPDQEHPQAFMMTNHGLEGSSAIKELVTLGPVALPQLLDALDDQTPTKVVIEHHGSFGVMSFAREMWRNPVNPAEQSLAKLPPEKDSEEESAETYTVKVGDVCFVAIGQIVGRGYEAVRYQPTACIVLNSPTHDAKLCARVRAVWKSDDPTRKLFDSLRADYATEGLFNGKSLDGWDMGNEMQCSAALRLLFYFPKESTGLVVGRLDKLEVGKDVGIDDFMKRCVANGVRSDDFLKSVAWSRDPAICQALTGVFRRADGVLDLMAALPAVSDKELIRKRLESALIDLPGADPGPYGEGYLLLSALVERTPATAKAMFDRYLQFPTPERRHTVCIALRDKKFAGDIDVLLPILSDRRTFGWTYAIVPGQNEPRLPIRVCDEAAVTLSQNHPTLKFEQAGQYADMDRQIAAMQAAIRENLAP